MKHTLWVDMQNKRISFVALDGFLKYDYDSEAGVNTVIKLLTADGYQMYQMAC